MYASRAFIHAASCGQASVLPNSPTMIGAMFCLYRYPQKWSHTAGRLFGNVGSPNHTWPGWQLPLLYTDRPYSCGEYTSRLATLSCTGNCWASESWPPHQSQAIGSSGTLSQTLGLPPLGRLQLTPSTKISQLELYDRMALPIRCAPRRQSRASPPPQSAPVP